MLNSFLIQQPGIRAIPLIRNNKMSKMDRIAQAQPKVKGGLIAFLRNSPHIEKVLTHMEKITKTGSNLLDDIADTLADAVYLTYFEKSVINNNSNEEKAAELMKKFKSGNFSSTVRLGQSWDSQNDNFSRGF